MPPMAQPLMKILYKIETAQAILQSLYLLCNFTSCITFGQDCITLICCGENLGVNNMLAKQKCIRMFTIKCWGKI